MTPKHKAKRKTAATRQAVLRIRYAIAPCSLGQVLAAATERGICAVILDDDRAVLCRRLAERFPKAEIVEAGGDFLPCIRKIAAIVDKPQKTLDLPLDLHGTAFQRRVWNALRTIAPGVTVSYAQLARKIGKPTAVRAVAQACGANPIGVIVPCHRVVRTDGALGGYRWGIDRKRTLLEREARAK